MDRRAKDRKAWDASEEETDEEKEKRMAARDKRAKDAMGKDVPPSFKGKPGMDSAAGRLRNDPTLTTTATPFTVTYDSISGARDNSGLMLLDKDSEDLKLVATPLSVPPYALVSISKRFGKDGAAPAKSNGPARLPPSVIAVAVNNPPVRATTPPKMP